MYILIILNAYNFGLCFLHIFIAHLPLYLKLVKSFPLKLPQLWKQVCVSWLVPTKSVNQFISIFISVCLYTVFCLVIPGPAPPMKSGSNPFFGTFFSVKNVGDEHQGEFFLPLFPPPFPIYQRIKIWQAYTILLFLIKILSKIQFRQNFFGKIIFWFLMLSVTIRCVNQVRNGIHIFLV